MTNKTADSDQSDGRYRWLTTFNDMMTLLMVFFVLLYAMSSPDALHFENFQNALQSAMGVLHPGQASPQGVVSREQNNDAPSVAAGPEQPGVERLNQLEETQGLEAEYSRKGIQLTLDDSLLFSSGTARLSLRGTDLLDKVVRIIAPLNRYVRVEGHTDNVPIRTRRYPSNWELSTARAVNVVKYIQHGGIPAGHLSAAGYGASKPRAVNDSEANRSKNRRVEIILQEQAPSNSKK